VSQPSNSTITPEAVQLRVDVAGLGSRMIALLLDTLIQVALLIPLLVGASAIGGTSGGAEIVVFALLTFAIVWLYFPLFEWLWNGRTPGKRSQRLRVVRTDGQPVGFAAVMVRNLVRIVDVFLLPFLAVISMVVTARAQRLGDLAAGTMVVRERQIPAAQPVEVGEGHGLPISMLDTSGLTEREYGLIRSFLARRWDLEARARQQLAAQLVASVRGRVGDLVMGMELSDERFLQAVAASYRARFAKTEGDRVDGDATGQRY
jgi:uncharacterized RDD family membrane protein YckC